MGGGKQEESDRERDKAAILGDLLPPSCSLLPGAIRSRWCTSAHWAPVMLRASAWSLPWVSALPTTNGMIRTSWRHSPSPSHLLRLLHFSQGGCGLQMLTKARSHASYLPFFFLQNPSLADSSWYHPVQVSAPHLGLIHEVPRAHGSSRQNLTAQPVVQGCAQSGLNLSSVFFLLEI